LDKKEVIVGKTASIGKVTGEIVYSIDKCKEINKKYILVTPLFLPDVVYSDSFQKVSGLIVETGSILCHAAIVARELEIPCLVGIENVYNTFKENTIVELNASESYAIIRGENL
jgi:pyruvate,water dikinase